MVKIYSLSTELAIRVIYLRTLQAMSETNKMDYFMTLDLQHQFD